MKTTQKNKFNSERNMPRLDGESQRNKATIENWTMKYGEKFYRLKKVDKKTVQQAIDGSCFNIGNIRARFEVEGFVTFISLKWPQTQLSI